MGGISLITIYDRKFRHNRPEEGLPKMITYISPINMVAEDNHLYFAYKSPLGNEHYFLLNAGYITSRREDIYQYDYIYIVLLFTLSPFSHHICIFPSLTLIIHHFIFDL